MNDPRARWLIDERVIRERSGRRWVRDELNERHVQAQAREREGWRGSDPE